MAAGQRRKRTVTRRARGARRPVKAASGGRQDPTTLALNGIRALVEALSRSARTVERRTGLTNAQLFLLGLVADRGAVTIGQLAIGARTTAATTSVVAGRLVTRGYLQKVRSSTDRRSSLLTLTPAGRAVVRRVPVPATSKLLAALKRIGPRDLRALTVGLVALTQAMGVDTVAPVMLFEAGCGLRRAARPDDGFNDKGAGVAACAFAGVAPSCGGGFFRT